LTTFETRFFIQWRSIVEKQDAGNDQCVRRDAAPGAEEGVSVDRAAETCSDGASGAAKSSAEMETKVGHARARHDSLAELLSGLLPSYRVAKAKR
jgi:hypothetical protein